jgi:endonuclease YncB( thermonuclease family)
MRDCEARRIHRLPSRTACHWTVTSCFLLSPKETPARRRQNTFGRNQSMQKTLIVWRLLLAAAVIAASPHLAKADACALEPQGEGRVDALVDARTFRLDDGREIRLVGIEPPPGQSSSSAPLAALVGGREVRLRGADDGPDRYGRQSVFVLTDNLTTSVQIELLRRGQALFSGLVGERACAADLLAAEAAARNSHQGLWTGETVIKNTERPGDILAMVGQFAIVEGKVLSARQSGTTFYINFGRRWTEGFAATISKRMIAPLEAAGLAPKSLENRRVRVRGWVEQRGGPRIDIFQPGQIELIGDK